MGVDDGTPPRRQRRRAVRAAGSASGETAGSVDGSVSTVPDASPPPDASGQPDPAPDPTSAEAPSLEKSADTPVLEDSSADAGPTRSRATTVVALAGLVIVVIALVASGIFLFLQNRTSDETAARGERFVQTARQTVLNLTTIHPDSAQADVDRLLAGASGDFKAEFEGREAPFVEVVQQARVDSTGDIVEAGIERQDDDSADVLVAAHAMVKNSDAEEAQPRDFRLRVTVVETDGVTTASRVEFVP